MQEYIKQIESEGFCRIPQVYPPDSIVAARELCEKWYERAKDSMSKNVPALAKNDKFVWNLQNKDSSFLKLLFASDNVQKLLNHFLNDRWFKQIPQDQPNYILRSFLARSSNLRLPMHIDSLVPYGGPHAFVMQTSIILEDQCEENGCTVVVPGSHRSGEYVDQSAFDDAIPVESKAGDVVVWDSRIWHGAQANKTDGTRWSLIATYVRWWIKQGFNFTANMPQTIYERLTASQKAVLGFCSIPYDTEADGIDMKHGYESLADNVSAYRSQSIVREET